jgi:hypothetical protein
MRSRAGSHLRQMPHLRPGSQVSGLLSTSPGGIMAFEIRARLRRCPALLPDASIPIGREPSPSTLRRRRLLQVTGTLFPT